MNIRKIFIIFALLILLIFSCSKRQENKEIDLKYDELLKEVDKNPDDINLKLSFMEFCTRDGDRPFKVVEIYESDANLKNNMMAEIYYATSLALMADKSSETIDKIKYVKRSMDAFDIITEEYPNEARAYMWKAITYSNFPKILGANDLTVEALEKADTLYELDASSLEDGELKQLVFAYFNLAKEYKNKEYYNSAVKSMEKYKLEGDSECIALREKIGKAI